jgi:adenosylcobinamide-phosphate synthase
VLYLFTRLARDRWQSEPQFGTPVRHIAAWLDWLPARAMALSFAIAGNFVDAMESWRGQAWQWGEQNEGVLLASAAGALGMQLGGNLPLAEGELQRPQLGVGAPPDASALQTSIALVWRAALIWLAVVGLFWLGGL